VIDADALSPRDAAAARWCKEVAGPVAEALVVAGDALAIASGPIGPDRQEPEAAAVMACRPAVGVD
jgi:hypothetical protein